jgi:hypothetical protein
MKWVFILFHSPSNGTGQNAPNSPEPMEGEYLFAGSNWKRQIAFIEVGKGKTHQFGIGAIFSDYKNATISDAHCQSGHSF